MGSVDRLRGLDMYLLRLKTKTMAARHSAKRHYAEWSVILFHCFAGHLIYGRLTYGSFSVQCHSTKCLSAVCRGARYIHARWKYRTDGGPFPPPPCIWALEYWIQIGEINYYSFLTCLVFYLAAWKKMTKNYPVRFIWRQNFFSSPPTYRINAVASVLVLV